MSSVLFITEIPLSVISGWGPNKNFHGEKYKREMGGRHNNGLFVAGYRMPGPNPYSVVPDVLYTVK